MAEQNQSAFETLSKVNVQDRVKEKNGLSYLSWSSAWAEVKKLYPDAVFHVYPQIIDAYGNTRFWHDDGKTGWVEVGVEIDGKEIVETLAIMDFKNKSIPADAITSVDANKSTKRCLVKACALHGLGLYIYDGEDLPEEASKVIGLRDTIKELVAKKMQLSDKAKETVVELCKTAEKKAMPWMDDSLIRGNYNNIDDVDILKELETQLLAVRK